jgi:hypothetical protein
LFGDPDSPDDNTGGDGVFGDGGGGGAYGVFLAHGGRGITAGDVNSDGVADLITTGDNLLGTGNRVVIFSGADLVAGKAPGFGATELADFAVGGQDPSALVSLGRVNADGDARIDLVVGSGAGRTSVVKVHLGKNLSGTTVPAATSLDPDGTVTTSGVFVG